MGDGGDFFHLRQPYHAAQISAKITIDFHSILGISTVVPRLAKTPSAVVMAVAKIIPTMAGRMHPSTAFTPAYLSKCESRVATSKMMIKDGKTTPNVANIAPKNPPCEEPTKVAILTAIGPGVDSATAIKLSSSPSVSHPCARQSSRIREIIAYPPPKETTPILRKVRKSER